MYLFVLRHVSLGADQHSQQSSSVALDTPPCSHRPNRNELLQRLNDQIIDVEPDS